MQISFIMKIFQLFSDQISGEGKVPRGGGGGRALEQGLLTQ